MTASRNRSAITTAALGLAAAAAAQVSAPAPAYAADGGDADVETERGAESENDPELSEIDGQLVPVGQHHEYILDHPEWNVASNPLGWIFGIYGLSVSYAPSERVTVRADANVFRVIDDGMRGFEVNAGAPIYFRRAFHGFFVEPGVMARHRTDRDDRSPLGVQVHVGWQWIWDSGLNVAAAVGAGRDFSSDDRYDAPVFPNGYFRLGYAF